METGTPSPPLKATEDQSATRFQWSNRNSNENKEQETENEDKLKGKEFIAMTDFTARTKEELSFRKGDLVIVKVS